MVLFFSVETLGVLKDSWDSQTSSGCYLVNPPSSHNAHEDDDEDASTHDSAPSDPDIITNVNNNSMRT